MIHVDRLSVRAGEFALDDVSFVVPTGKYGVLMGRTGSGKTTILEAICGLKPVVSGRILLDGRDVTHLKPAQRGIGFVPQDGALFSTMTVREQLAFALVIRKWSKDRIGKRIEELADLLGIAHLLTRRPYGLSGGERQRVALGRALAARPNVLCLDEPLSALADQTREEMYGLLRSVEERTGVTSLHITHNVSEAERLGDKMFFLKNGSIEESDVDSVPKSIQQGGEEPSRPATEQSA